MTEPLDSERGDFTVTIEYDVRGAASPHDAVALALEPGSYESHRVTKIARVYLDTERD